VWPFLAATAHIRLAAVLAGLVAGAWSTEVPRTGGPRPDTIRAFNQYIHLTESVLDARLEGDEASLWPQTSLVRGRLRHGEVICAPRNKTGDVKVPYGLIHDWIGAIFIPGATVGGVLKVVQDYDNHKATYSQEVMDSRILEHNGNDYRIYLRLLKRKVITVVLDTEHEVHYRSLGRNRWCSRSSSIRIAEVENPRRRGERWAPPGKDHGFLWRLNSYWMFVEEDGGVYVECEAISLSRGVPASLAWLIGPIVRSLPVEALAGTLRATRDGTIALAQPGS